MSMFAIGSKEWPGLSKLNEECGEAIQVIGKLMGTGGHVEHWDGSRLDERLAQEMADVLAAVSCVMEANAARLDTDLIERRAKVKLDLFRKWRPEGSPDLKEWIDYVLDDAAKKSASEGKGAAIECGVLRAHLIALREHCIKVLEERHGG